MRSRARIAAATTAAMLAAASLLVGAVSSSAAGPPIESYQTGGQARGVDVAFTFSGSIFERLADLGLPHARSNVTSEGGGAARGVAAQLFPGDLVIGALGEGFPGYRQAVFPAEQAADAPDNAHVTDPFEFAGAIPLPGLPGVIPPGGGPVAVEYGRLVTKASVDSASGTVTTNILTLGPGNTPLITARSLETTSDSTRSVDHVDHTATTIVRDIDIHISDELSVNVGQLVSRAHTTSDGASPKAETSLKISGVTVNMGGTVYDATIDEQGIRIVGVPKVPLPSPLPADPVPSVIPQDLNQVLEGELNQASVRISTAQGTKTVDDLSSDASLNGLLVTFTGFVPSVFVPDVVAELVAQVQSNLPEDVRRRLERSICYQADIRPFLERLAKPLADGIGDIPVCLSPQAVPGPGSGVVTTISIGSVRSASAAVQAIPIIDVPPVDGGVFPTFPVDPGFGGQVPGGFPGTPVDPGAGQPDAGRPLVRTGLVARMPSAALLAVGAGFLVLAMGLAMGPSLRGWRASRVT